ncbi:MAG: hypothetical protein ACXVFL_20315, partial [Solirubrobacteraceae bacterium]
AGGRAIGVATNPSIPRELMLVTPLDRAPSAAGAALLELLHTDPDAPGTGASGGASTTALS